jgi:SAM-dependent methyltransferase
MKVRSNLEWEKWGQHDPLWAVAAWRGRRRDGVNPWTDSAFYALGALDWDDFRSHWVKYGVPRGSAVEIGCGAGRLTGHMATFFDHVQGLDVSAGMLDYAKHRINHPNVTFTLVDGASIPRPDDTVDAVFSTHVFQHLDSTVDVERYLREIARVLKPGGSMMIHLPLFAWPKGAGRWIQRLYRIRRRIEDFRASRERRKLAAGAPVRFMRMNSYPISYFYSLLPRLGMSDIEVSIFVTTSNNDPHPFVLARKDATA